MKETEKQFIKNGRDLFSRIYRQKINFLFLIQCFICHVALSHFSTSKIAKYGKYAMSK